MESARSAELSLTRKHRAGLFLLAVFLGFLLLNYKYFLPASLIKLAAAGAVACVIALLLFARPKYGLLLGVFYICAGMAFYFQFPAAYPIIVIVTCAVAADLMKGDNFRLRSAGFNWALTIFIMLVVQSMLIARDVSLSLFELTEVAKSMVMVYLVVQLIRTPRDLHQYALVIFVGTLATVFLGLLNFKMGWVESASTGKGVGIRFTGTYGNPNEFASHLASAIPLGIYAARKFRRWYSRAVMMLGTALILVMIFTSYSRAAVFPLGLIMVAMLVRGFRRSKAVLLVIIATAAIALMLTPVTYWNRLATLSEIASGQSADWSIFVRLRAMEVAWDLFLAHPFTGVGYGNFIIRSAPYFFQRMAVHNGYLQLLVGLGIFGLVAYIAMCASVAGHALTAMRKRWRKQDEWMQDLSFYFLVSFLATLVSLLFAPAAFEYLVWLPAAGALAAGRIAVASRDDSRTDDDRGGQTG